MDRPNPSPSPSVQTVVWFGAGLACTIRRVLQAMGTSKLQIPLELDRLKQRLASQLSRAEAVLFLGAGFSLDAKDHQGVHLPTSQQLAEELWAIAFPGTEFDNDATLGDTFHCALAKSPVSLRDLLHRRLSVKSDELPDHYAVWMSMPWFRCYTLNIDNLEIAVQHSAALERPLQPISAVSGELVGDASSINSGLGVVHLNGMLGDDIHSLTFSDRDYGLRLSTPDSWLVRASADMMGRPVVYVGTALHEPTLWQYVEARAQKGGRHARELRPGSYLVTPKLTAARQVLLKGLNVNWIPLTAKEFADTWLRDMGASKASGQKAISSLRLESNRNKRPQLVSELANNGSDGSKEYLMGTHPDWGDLRSGRAIRRDCDDEVHRLATSWLQSNEISPPLVITGTAGSGKSTALMRLALRLSGDGIRTYWIDERTNLEPHLLGRVVRETEGPVAVLIDDADLWGRALTNWAVEIPRTRARVVLCVALRASRIDGLLESSDLSGVQPTEIAIPPLSDPDINALLDVLDRENRLGVLKGKPHRQRVAAFRHQAGRQLLVAMIQATSGRRFTDKVYDEFKELKGDSRFIYGLICVVSAQRYTIDRTELLLAFGSADNPTMNAIETLYSRHLVLRATPHTGYASRHRVIAEQLMRNAEFLQLAGQLLRGVVFAFANCVDPTISKHDRRWRRLIRFMNHDYLMRVMPVDDARAVYESIESILSWDYHYWLQRGSLEVEEGDLTLARNFLDQARTLTDSDRFVENEYAYLLMKTASSNPAAHDAPDQFADGLGRLEHLIEADANQGPHPYHVIGSQVLAWVRRAGLTASSRSSLLATALRHVKNGMQLYPKSNDLQTLRPVIEREWLLTAVSQHPRS